jgi:LacI family transcriptional regulator
VGAFFAAAALGLRVPEDVSVVSLDDREQLVAQLSPAATYVSRPDDQMAAHAAGLLIERLESDTTPATQHYSFACPVVVGASIGPPAPGGRTR